MHGLALRCQLSSRVLLKRDKQHPDFRFKSSSSEISVDKVTNVRSKIFDVVSHTHDCACLIKVRLQSRLELYRAEAHVRPAVTNDL